MPQTESSRLAHLTLAATFIIATLASTLLLLLNHASAATLSQVLVRFDRMNISTATTGTVCAKPATTAVEATVQVAYPTGYTVSTTLANWTVSTTNLAWPTGAVAWPGIATATNVTGQTVTFPSTDLTVGTLYCFNWTNAAAVSVKAAASSSNTGTVTTNTSVPAVIDTATYSVASLTSDQIAVSAVVPQAFSFALSGTTDNLGTLSTGSVTSSPTPRTAAINTNAKNGWYVWAQDASPSGLTSSAAAYTIASTTGNTTLAAGTEGYNTGVTSSQTAGSGTITVASTFAGGTLGKGGGLSTALQALASSNGTANNAVLTLTNNAAISPTTPGATDYADTITVVGAGLF